ncbi:MAG: ribonuclease HI [Clostridia bacterium]|nr:ribonuclease HI [Clostridia bacterium]
MKKVEIYTDGACSGNPGPGGYAGILFYNGKEKVISGGEETTTNNRMELTAVIKALEVLKEICEVNLYTDSAYVCNAITQNWLTDWQLNNWKNSQKKSVLNKDLWLQLIELITRHKVNFIKVKGHSDNINNNRCDEIARNEILKFI